MAYNVLVVDDSKAMRLLILRNLRNAGMNIATGLEAANGLEAQSQLSSQSVDLIFSDWNMPEMNGLEFLRWVRQSAPNKAVPFFLITTESGKDQIDEATLSGVTGYLSKPFTSEDLTNKLAGYL
jgi:two-component system chemotaxis response regulator CheY